MGAIDGNGVGSALSRLVGELDGLNVGRTTGETVGIPVGDKVGSPVGLNSGTAEGFLVGLFEGKQLGFDVEVLFPTTELVGSNVFSPRDGVLLLGP